MLKASIQICLSLDSVLKIILLVMDGEAVDNSIKYFNNLHKLLTFLKSKIFVT